MNGKIKTDINTNGFWIRHKCCYVVLVCVYTNYMYKYSYLQELEATLCHAVIIDLESLDLNYVEEKQLFLM